MHIIQKSQYRSHTNANEVNISSNKTSQRTDYPAGSTERQSLPVQINHAYITRPAQSKSTLPHESVAAISSASHSNSYTPSDRSNPGMFMPLSVHTDRSKYHMVHKSYDDLYQRSSIIAPMQPQYLVNYPGREKPPVAGQNAHNAKMPRHFEPYAGGGGKSATPTPSQLPPNDPLTTRKSFDPTIYPRSQSANIFYHEQDRLKAVDRDIQLASNNLLSPYSYGPSNSAKSHNEYYNQFNAATQQKWSNEMRITQSPIASPHPQANPNMAMSQNPISASSLPYGMHRQNPSVNTHSFFFQISIHNTNLNQIFHLIGEPECNISIASPNTSCITI